jgi:hypothetical protein
MLLIGLYLLVLFFCKYKYQLSSYQLFLFKNYEKHRGGLPCGWRREASKEQSHNRPLPSLVQT